MQLSEEEAYSFLGGLPSGEYQLHRCQSRSCRQWSRNFAANTRFKRNVQGESFVTRHHNVLQPNQSRLVGEIGQFGGTASFTRPRLQWGDSPTLAVKSNFVYAVPPSFKHAHGILRKPFALPLRSASMAIKYVSPAVLSHIDVLTHCRYLILLSRQGKVVRNSLQSSYRRN